MDIKTIIEPMFTGVQVASGEELVAEVDIHSLRQGDTPRVKVDESHVSVLVAAGMANLPPILVHRSTMRVIDGMHRVRAAQLCGVGTIRVRFYEGTEVDAFVLAVKSNTAHGLPLTLAERKHAAHRILCSHPELSDRAIGVVAGIDHKTVGAIRSSSGEIPQSNARIGLDGRLRTTSQVRPQPAVRPKRRDDTELAGTEKKPEHKNHDLWSNGATAAPTSPIRQEKRNQHKTSRLARRNRLVEHRGRSDDLAALILQLQKDPSFRFNEKGRVLLRLLDMNAKDIGAQSDLSTAVPTHLADVVAQVAAECSMAWRDFAIEVSRRHDLSAG